MGKWLQEIMHVFLAPCLELSKASLRVLPWLLLLLMLLLCYRYIIIHAPRALAAATALGLITELWSAEKELVSN